MRRLTFVLGVLFAVTPARAHDADVISVLTTAERSGALEQHVTMTPATAVLLAPLDADGDSTLTQRDLDTRSLSLTAGVWEQMRLEAAGAPCTRSGEGAVLHEGYVELFARFVCGPGELRQSFRFLSILPPNYRVVLSSQVEGARTQAFAQGALSTVTLARPTPQTKQA